MGIPTNIVKGTLVVIEAIVQLTGVSLYTTGSPAKRSPGASMTPSITGLATSPEEFDGRPLDNDGTASVTVSTSGNLRERDPCRPFPKIAEVAREKFADIDLLNEVFLVGSVLDVYWGISGTLLLLGMFERVLARDRLDRTPAIVFCRRPSGRWRVKGEFSALATEREGLIVP
jgi:hypothetical protein